jgi:hypothetical protein
MINYILAEVHWPVVSISNYMNKRNNMRISDWKTQTTRKVSATCMPHQSNQPGSIFLNIPLKNKVSINNFPLPNKTYYHYTYLLSGYNFQRNYSVIYLKISCTISNHNDRLVAMVLKTKKESQQGGKK